MQSHSFPHPAAGVPAKPDDPPIDTPVLLTSRQAARLCGVGERTLWRWAHSGSAPAPLRPGGRAVRYRRDELLAWIAAGCPPTGG